MKSNRTLALVAALLTVPVWHTPVFAQQRETEEIIVTARKRQESLINVPVIETAISRTALERTQTFSVLDIQKVVPGLTIGHNIHTIGTQVSVRGIGTTSSDQGVDSSVALNIDGMTMTNGLAFSSGMFDLQQIEVMKGPQSLFFGKASPGGVIAIRTADPTDKWEVIGRVGHDFEATNTRVEAIISGPLSDKLKVRLAGLYSHSNGYFHNVAVPLAGTGAVAPYKNEYIKNEILRGTILFNPTDNFSARIKYTYVHDFAINAETYQLVNCPNGNNFAPFGPTRNFFGGDDCTLNRNIGAVYMDRTAFPYVMNGGVPFMSIYQNYTIAELNWNITPEMTLTSTTGHFYMNGKALVNATHTAYAGPALGSENQYRKRDTTEELRLNTDFAGPLNATVGALYQAGQINYHPYRFGNVLYGLPAFQVETIDIVDLKTYSLFGQLRWKIVPRLELAGGLRWTDEARSQTPYNVNLVTHVPVYLPLAVPRIHSSTVVPEFTITYRPTDDLTIFAAYKHAYKSGSYSVTTLPAAGQDNSFGDEKVKGGEIGMKSRWMDRRLSFNAAGYYYHFAGLQSGAISPAANGLPVIRTINAGSARTYGIDMDAAYSPESVPGLDLKAAIGWSHARYIRLNNVPCWANQTISQGCDQFLNPATGLYTAQELSGTPLTRAPDWQINLGFDYEFALSPKYNMTISSSNSYTSRYKTAVSKRLIGDNFQKAAFKADLTFAVSSADGLWELALIGKNIGDKLTAAVCSQSTFANGAVLGGTITGGVNPGIAGISESSCASDPGREIWLRLTVKPLNAFRD